MNPSTEPSRRSLALCCLALGAHVLVGCATLPAKPTPPAMGWIALSPDHRSFVEGRAPRQWVPWGFNYDHDDGPDARLLEDYWGAEWSRVERDFHEMRSMGATVVRVHLQLPRFMRSASLVDEGSLARFQRLLALAEREGLRLGG